MFSYGAIGSVVWVRDLPVWENGLQIAKFQGPRISLSEGLECVENTGFEGDIAFSPHELGASGDIGFIPKAGNINGLRAVK